MDRMNGAIRYLDARLDQAERDNEKLEKENKNLKERVEELEKEKSRDGLLGQATMEEAYNRITELEEENKNLTKCNLNLQEWLDNKEKVNKSLREELEKLKSTYVYDAKQVRDIC